MTGKMWVAFNTDFMWAHENLRRINKTAKTGRYEENAAMV